MNKFWMLALVALVLTAGGCAGKRGPEKAKTPPDSRQTPVGAADDELTPQRAASNALIDDGEKAFTQGRYDSAADLFQEAATVDPSNGAAFYHLARAKIRSGEYGEAEGLIEKADQLLGSDKDPSSDWPLKLEELKREFHQKKP